MVQFATATVSTTRPHKLTVARPDGVINRHHAQFNKAPDHWRAIPPTPTAPHRRPTAPALAVVPVDTNRSAPGSHPGGPHKVLPPGCMWRV